MEHVCPGDVLNVESGFLRGHGTQLTSDLLTSTVAGFVTRVNKLVSVIPLKSRYMGEIGDVVVGRIQEVGEKRWKVEIQARQDAALHLSSVILPGGAQRRRTAEDALQMRSLYREGDLISAEIQSVHQDGSVSLHTRSNKYGKLINGVLVTVQQALVRRCKQHFFQLEGTDVVIILGNNGFIWLSRVLTEEEKKEKERLDQLEDNDSSTVQNLTTNSIQRIQVARARNSILALSLECIAIHPSTILSVFNESSELEVKDMLSENNRLRITNNAREIGSQLTEYQ